MNRKSILRAIAVSTACLGMGVLVLGGCKKGDDGHTHTWGKYYSDGESGHYRLTTCIDHATVKSEIEAHDGDVCSKCGYTKSTSGIISVTVTGKNSVKVGGKIQLGVTVTPSDATVTAVTWAVTEGGEHAEIDSNGVLTGIAKGSVKVQATVGGVKGTLDVEVLENSGTEVAVTGVVLDKGTLELKEGETATLTATVKPEDADDQTVTWSSDSAAATVENGVVTAVSAGTANITVTSNDNNQIKATCVVTVKAAEPGKDPSKPSDPIGTPDDPVIEGPVQGGVKITKPSAEQKYTPQLETAYVEWEAAENAKWYNVYYSPAGAENWTKLDAPLIRQYKADENHANNYYRADAIGLKAGEYDMKVVPVAGDDSESAQYAATVKKMTVYAHERFGYAFTENCVPGAYNLDGTLKTGAQVVYVTAETAKTVTATVNGTQYTGFQTILDAYQKGSSDPIAFRVVGRVSASDMDHLTSTGEGLQIKGNGVSKPAENVTIEGVGNDGSFKDFGMLLRNCKNVEVRNLGIINCIDDGISIDTDNYHLWVHNNDIFYGKNGGGDKAKGDGALDTKQSSLITHSYNHFWDCGKCNLQGMKSEYDNTRITYHHNWYDHSDSRHPRIRSATVHIFNNFFDGNAKYGVGVTYGASAFVENNYFRSTAQMKPMMSSQQGTDAAADKGTFSGESGGMIKAYGNVFDCSASNLKLLTQNDTTADNIDCYLATSRTEKVPATYKTKVGGTTYNNFDTASDMYEYTVDTPEQARDKVMTYAGRVDGGDFKWTFDNVTQDPNYAIIPELGTAVLNYDDKILKIGS